jgi:hypothetical protein
MISTQDLYILSIGYDGEERRTRKRKRKTRRD